ncbi:MAG: amidohydrolase family protein [Candidatus Atribacteria bacterium]|nr:amidohydrolase family protein [Candidatus Atribacteria bacterium]
MKSIVIRQANTRLFDYPVDIAIVDGKIKEIGKNVALKGDVEIDAKDKLVTESFVNPHLHLCKVYTLIMMDEEALKAYQGGAMGKAMNAIELAARVKEKYNESWILENARKALKLAALNGVTHIRAFADVDSKAKLEGVKALIKAREEFKNVVEMQVVAFPQDGVVKEVGAYDLMKQAMDLGADVVGGIPWIELTEADEQKHIDLMFEIAKEYNKDVSMLVDDAGDPGLRTLEMLAVKTIKEGWFGRTLAHHARAMALYPEPYFQKVVSLLKKAQMGVVSDPHTGPLHARVRDLLDEDVLVMFGQDDISDAYYPYGRNNMLEVLFLASHILWMTTRSDMEKMYDMITVKPAKAIGLKNFKLEVGAEANLVVLNEGNVLEAIRNHGEPLYVISHGELIDKSKFNN